MKSFNKQIFSTKARKLLWNVKSKLLCPPSPSIPLSAVGALVNKKENSKTIVFVGGWYKAKYDTYFLIFLKITLDLLEGWFIHLRYNIIKFKYNSLPWLNEKRNVWCVGRWDHEFYGQGLSLIRWRLVVKSLNFYTTI